MMHETNSKINNSILSRFGFNTTGKGTHTSRTMMYEEFNLVLNNVKNIDAKKEDFFKAITEQNCLGKRSANNRSLSAKHLVELYALDPSVTVFRLLRYFWERDEIGRPLLALLCVFARDALIRQSMPFIYNHTQGETVTRVALEDFIKKKITDHYSDNTLKSVAQNINSTWTKSGHLQGRAKKIRTKATATPGSVAYALLLSYLTGARGEYLFNTQFTRVLDCSFSELLDLAEEASRRGWIVLKRIGEVIEVQFPSLLTKEELEWVNEQNR